jgi:hypothetical protein
MSLPYIAGRDFVTVMHDGVTHTVREGMTNYAALREAIRDKEWDRVPELLSPARAVESFGEGRITVVDGEVRYNGEPLHNAVTQRIMEMVRDGFDAQPLMSFLEKLMQNPSRVAVTELYDWLERTSLPITEDGDFLAYKKVKSNYMDFFTGKMNNSVGQILEMARNQVDDVRDRTCSYGLHFCSLSYLPSYHGGEGRVMIVKINPADVVSIPSDYDFAKGRTCRYEVIGEHTGGEHKEAFSTPVVNSKGEAVNGTHTNKPAAPVTAVMGVEFGNAARAAMVQALVNQVTQHYSDYASSPSPEQGCVDGFDDAWYNRAPDLGRYQSSGIRAAVDYARGYFEGYDQCRSGINPSSAPAPAASTKATVVDTGVTVEDFEYEGEVQRAEISRVLGMPVGTRKHGYNNGWVAGNRTGYDDGQLNHFNLSGAEEGGKGYRRGYIDGYLTGFNH